MKDIIKIGEFNKLNENYDYNMNHKIVWSPTYKEMNKVLKKLNSDKKITITMEDWDLNNNIEDIYKNESGVIQVSYGDYKFMVYDIKKELKPDHVIDGSGDVNFIFLTNSIEHGIEHLKNLASKCNFKINEKDDLEID